MPILATIWDDIIPNGRQSRYVSEASQHPQRTMEHPQSTFRGAFQEAHPRGCALRGASQEEQLKRGHRNERTPREAP